MACLGLQINFSRSKHYLTQHFPFHILYWDRVDVSVSVHLDKLLEILQLVNFLLQTQPVTSLSGHVLFGKD